MGCYGNGMGLCSYRIGFYSNGYMIIWYLDRDLLYIFVTYQKSSTIRRRDKSKDDAILADSCYALCFGKA